LYFPIIVFLLLDNSIAFGTFYAPSSFKKILELEALVICIGYFDVVDVFFSVQASTLWKESKGSGED
jgi:hypothetical protein